MSQDNKESRLRNLLSRATIIEETISKAIASSDDKVVSDLSAKFDEITSSILSLRTETFSDLKHKCAFSQKLLMLDHNDPSFVSEIFTTMMRDIDNISHTYSSKSKNL